MNQSGSGFNLGLAENNVICDDISVFAEGIAFENSSQFTLIGNSVTGDVLSPSGNSYRFMISPNGVIHNNSSTGTNRGFFFQDFCPTLNQIRNNSMNVNWHGLEMDPAALIDIQDWRANNWPGYNFGTVPYDDGLIPGEFVGAVNENSSLGGIQGSRFIVSDIHTQGTTRFPDFFPPAGSSAFDWFTPALGNEPIPSYLACLAERQINTNLNALDSLIVIDSVFAVAYEQELREISKISLFDKLTLIQETSGLNSYFETYYENFKTTPSGRIVTVRDSVFNLLRISYEQLLSNALADSIIFYHVDEFDSLLMAEVSEASFDTFAFRINLVKPELDSIAYDFHQAIANIASGAISALQVITSSTTIELNLKQAYIGIFQYLSRQYDPETMWENLNSIASQCPEEGGPGVLLSRGILASIDYSQSYNDEAICYPQTRLMDIVIKDNPNENLSLTVFPNPNMGTFEITGKSLALENDLTIQDLAGRVIPFGLIKTDETRWTIKLKAVSPGTYLLKLVNKDSGELLSVSKIIISN